MDCLFCKIATGKLQSDVLYEDNEIVAFKDLNPKAPHHVLIIPRRHIATVNDLEEDDSVLVGDMVQVAKKLAVDLGIADSGYRLLFNCNQDAGQAIFHIHLHLIGGRPLHWPPG